MAAPMKATCEECGKVFVFEKDEGLPEVIDVGMGELRNVCEDCAQKHREHKHALVEEENENGA